MMVETLVLCYSPLGGVLGSSLLNPDGTWPFPWCSDSRPDLTLGVCRNIVLPIHILEVFEKVEVVRFRHNDGGKGDE